MHTYDRGRCGNSSNQLITVCQHHTMLLQIKRQPFTHFFLNTSFFKRHLLNTDGFMVKNRRSLISESLQHDTTRRPWRPPPNNSKERTGHNRTSSNKTGHSSPWSNTDVSMVKQKFFHWWIIATQHNSQSNTVRPNIHDTTKHNTTQDTTCHNTTMTTTTTTNVWWLLDDFLFDVQIVTLFHE